MKAIITVDEEATDTVRGWHDRNTTVIIVYPEGAAHETWTEAREEEIVRALTGSELWMWWKITSWLRGMGRSTYKLNYGYDSGD